MNNRSKVLLMILMFCSVMLVFYTAVQYVQGGQNKKESEVAEIEMRELEVQNAQYRVQRDVLRDSIQKCCKDSIKHLDK